jgi:beta-glucosidase
MVYGEDIYVGYRYYDAIELPVRFPFGHGLSYTKFTMANLRVSQEGDDVIVKLHLRNVGICAGAEVVQIYISQQAPSLKRPPRELRGFAKRYLEPSESIEVVVHISLKYATSFWDESVSKWTSDAGKYDVMVGDSSRPLSLMMATFETRETFSWRGL